MKKIFINYSWKHDTKNAEKVYDALSAFSDNFKVWMDSKSMEGGLKWRPAIRKAIREADYFIAVLSSGSVVHRGVVNKELYEAVDVLKEFPPSQIFLIPARVEDCTSPFEDLAELNYVDLFPDWDKGMNKLITSMNKNLVFTNLSKNLKGLNSIYIKNMQTDTSVLKNINLSKKIKKEKVQKQYHYRVGLADLDVGMKNLKKIVDQLNKIQNYFLFTLPEMLPLKNKIQKIDGLKSFNVSKVTKADVKRNIHLETDLLACITGYPLAFETKTMVYSNYFAGETDHDERFLFLSTDQLKEFSVLSGIKFEEALVFIITGQLINYFTKMGYHDDTRGCVMDHCETRKDIVKGLKKRTLCPVCEKKLHKGELRNAINLLLKWKYK